MAERTPKSLLQALDLITGQRPPMLETVGRVGLAHAKRVRTVFDDKNIVAVGISEKFSERKGTGQLGICFYVEKKVSPRKVRSANLVPPVISSPDGMAVYTDVKEIGRLVPQYNVRRTPVQSGYSVAHRQVTAGTIGAIVKKGTNYFVLSNSHVLAHSGLAKVGDVIVYPGPADGGLAADRVATLDSSVPFTLGGAFVNQVDAALGLLDPGQLGNLDFKIYGAKSVAMVAPVRDMVVVKRGRTTGDTQSVVRDVNFRFILDYKGKVGKVGFLDQVLCDRYTDGGDSGSLVVDKKSGSIVGLHFAGANGGSVFNPIHAVAKALAFRFVTA